MEVFQVGIELILALAAAAAFALGFLAQRWLLRRREHRAIELLEQKIGELERQRDAAHQAALDLAARHAELQSRRPSAESMLLGLTLDSGRRYAGNDNMVEGYDVHVSEMNEASWPMLEAAR